MPDYFHYSCKANIHIIFFMKPCYSFLYKTFDLDHLFHTVNIGSL